MSDEILTAQGAAQFLKISTKLLYKLINTGEIPAKKIGNGFRIRRTSLESYMNNSFDVLDFSTDNELPHDVLVEIQTLAHTEAKKRMEKRTLVETYGDAVEAIYNHNEGETNE